MTFGIVIRILVLCCLVGAQFHYKLPVPVRPTPNRRPIPTRPTTSGPTISKENAACGGFTVRGGKMESMKVHQKLQFQDLLTNLGGWSTLTNDFEALCTGAYFFTFSVLSPENGDFTLALVKNGESQVPAYGSKSGYQTGSNSALLILAIGDKIHLELEEGAIYENLQDEFYNDFTGYLVKEF